MTLTDIREAKATKVAEARSLLATENLTAEGKAKFDALKGEIEALEKDEARAQFVEDIERRASGQPVDKAHAKLEAQVNVLDVIRSQMEGRALSGAAAEYSAEAERRSGRKPEGAFIPLAALETRASTTTSASQIVPTDYRPDQFIEPFRNSLLARRLGVRVLSGLSGNVSIPKYGTGLTTGWVAENAALSTSDMTFASPVTLTPKHAGGITELSRQLIQQSSPDIEQLVRDDLSARLDLTAFVLVGQNDRGAWQVQAHFWAPEKGLADRAKRDRAPYDVWARQGYITLTPGASVDYEIVARDLAEFVADLDLRGIAFDRWRMDVLAKELDRLGLVLPLEPWGQGFKDMSPALDSLEAELVNGRLAHGGNPVLTMCAANATTTKDPAGGRKLDKSRATGRIDGLQALAMAMGLATRQEETATVPDEIFFI